MAVLQAQQLTKRYRDHTALDRLDLSADEGEVLCLLGPNGAGKTTTLNLFMGFLQPDEGSASIRGVVVHENPVAARQHIGYVPEVVQLYPHLNGIETWQYFNELAGRSARDEAEVRSALRHVGLSDEAHTRRVNDYSKGMRQKLAISLALAKDADVLLLDEPLSGLDPKAANDLVKLIRALADDGKTVLAVTHDIFRARQMADRIGIMRDGQLLDMLDAHAHAADSIESRYIRHLDQAEASATDAGEPSGHKS